MYVEGRAGGRLGCDSYVDGSLGCVLSSFTGQFYVHGSQCQCNCHYNLTSALHLRAVCEVFFTWLWGGGGGISRDHRSKGGGGGAATTKVVIKQCSIMLCMTSKVPSENCH